MRPLPRRRARGIGVVPLSLYCLRRTAVSGLVIGYGRLHESTIDHAVRELAVAIGPTLDHGDA